MKRCVFCQRQFCPYPQTAKIQKSCSRVACRRARHRSACQTWAAKNAGYNRYRYAKIRTWPQGSPSYWQLYRASHPSYRAAEKARMRRRRSQRKKRRKTRRDSVDARIPK